MPVTIGRTAGTAKRRNPAISVAANRVSHASRPGTDEFYVSYSRWRTHQMSDHLPMWVELHVDFSEEYLAEVEADIEAQLDDDS